jgi:hypothetical protein
MELSTIDQKWGRLFNNEGNPTQRLGQFLRGLANHIVRVMLSQYPHEADTNVYRLMNFRLRRASL